MTKQTTFSPDRRHRYTLWRTFRSSELPFDGALPTSGHIQFIGLNPSTADETNDDPTVRRCVNYAKGWGFFEMCMTNAFAFRSTDPRGMLSAPDPVGEDNDERLLEVAASADLIVCCWGRHGLHAGRHDRMKELLKPHAARLRCFKLNADGTPVHPLYQRADAPLINFKI